jgi:hypothetical protein
MSLRNLSYHLAKYNEFICTFKVKLGYLVVKSRVFGISGLYFFLDSGGQTPVRWDYAYILDFKSQVSFILWTPYLHLSAPTSRVKSKEKRGGQCARGPPGPLKSRGSESCEELTLSEKEEGNHLGRRQESWQSKPDLLLGKGKITVGRLLRLLCNL